MSLFDKNKKNGAMPELVKGTVCKTALHRFESDSHLFYFARLAQLIRVLP